MQPRKYSPASMHIELDDLSRPVVHDLLREHLANMYGLTPADKVYALDLEDRHSVFMSLRLSAGAA